MTAMNLTDAVAVTGLSRKRIIEMMVTGQWDIGEIIKNPTKQGRTYIIWSHKLAKVMGVPEQAVLDSLAKMDRERRNDRVHRKY